jgi:hypothetical protein
MGLFADFLGTLRSTFRIGNANISTSGLTVQRAVAFPDKDGTLAMLSDIGGSGITGDKPVFVQATPPTPPGGNYLWVQTGLGPTGDNVTFWIEDGT